MDAKTTNYSSETNINIGFKSNKDQSLTLLTDKAHQKLLMVSVRRK